MVNVELLPSSGCVKDSTFMSLMGKSSVENSFRQQSRKLNMKETWSCPAPKTEVFSKLHLSQITVTGCALEQFIALDLRNCNLRDTDMPLVRELVGHLPSRMAELRSPHRMAEPGDVTLHASMRASWISVKRW
jgi:hypothetical protein